MWHEIWYTGPNGSFMKITCLNLKFAAEFVAIVYSGWLAGSRSPFFQTTPAMIQSSQSSSTLTFGTDVRIWRPKMLTSDDLTSDNLPQHWLHEPVCSVEVCPPGLGHSQSSSVYSLLHHPAEGDSNPTFTIFNFKVPVNDMHPARPFAIRLCFGWYHWTMASRSGLLESLFQRSEQQLCVKHVWNTCCQEVRFLKPNFSTYAVPSFHIASALHHHSQNDRQLAFLLALDTDVVPLAHDRRFGRWLRKPLKIYQSLHRHVPNVASHGNRIVHIIRDDPKVQRVTSDVRQLFQVR